MTEDDTTLDPADQAYADAYNKVVANHVVTAASAPDSRVTCSCGDVGTAEEMAGHWGAEAERAGQTARESAS